MTPDDYSMEDSKSSIDSQSVVSVIPSVISRLFWLVTGVAIQIAAMIVVSYNSETGSGLGLKLWQSGKLGVYADLLLNRQCSIYFFPLMIPSTIALAVYCRRPTITESWMGLLLLVGLLIQVHFAVLLVLAFDNYIVYGPLAAIITASIIAQILRVIASVKRFNIAWIWGLTTIVALVSVSLAQIVGDGLQNANETLILTPILFASGAIISAPCLGICTYAWAGRCYLSQRSKQTGLSSWRFSPGAGLAVVVWLTGYFFAWKHAVEMMLKLYSTLPPTKPGCYICTAAANGHARLVGSRINSSGFLFNSQMQYLKVLEFAIAFGCPRIHRLMRIIYDRLGPSAAQVVASNRWLADMAYLSWLPAEFVARVLVRILRIDRSSIHKLYQ